MAVDPIESMSVRGPSWDAYDAYYNQESPVKQTRKTLGVPPYALYDTLQPSTGPQSGSVDLNVSNGVNGVGNDRKILKYIFAAASQRQDSHEAIEQDALEAIFKNKEMIKVLQRNIAKEQDKHKNASFMSRAAGWFSWFFGGAFVLSVFVAMGVAVATGAVVGAAAISNMITGVLGLFQAISTATKAVFDYKKGRHEQEIEQLKFELTKRQKALKSKIGQINTEEQQKNSEISRLADLQKNYYRAGRVFGG